MKVSLTLPNPPNRSHQKPQSSVQNKPVNLNKPKTKLACVHTCSHLHVARQGADPPLTSSAGQEDGDDGQQGADSQQSASSGAQHRTGLRETQRNGILLVGRHLRACTSWLAAGRVHGNVPRIHLEKQPTDHMFQLKLKANCVNI